ncbi:MAG: putative sensor protein [Frankiales bacterium]|nr:putative sensor protein [Frankiales bacterium]
MTVPAVAQRGKEIGPRAAYGQRVSPEEDAVCERPPLNSLDDPARIAAVARVVGRGRASARLDMLVTLAAQVLHAPAAQVSLLTATERVVAAAYGIELTDQSRRGPREDSLCALTAASGGPLIVADTRSHPWVRDLPPVRSGEVGSYLGVVLADPAGHVLGSLCVHGPDPRPWTSEHVEQLTDVARLVSAELAGHADGSDSDAVGVRASLAAEAAELGSFVYDFAGTGELDWDERMLALHGTTAAAFDRTLEAFEALVHPEDVPGMRQRFEHARDVLGELVLEYRVVLPEGKARWVRVRARVLPDMLGAPSRLVGAAYDASTERELRDELIRLMETMPAALLRVDSNRTVTYVNAVAEKLCRKGREEVLGRHVLAAFPEVRGTSFEDTYEEVLRTGRPGLVEAYMPRLEAYFDVRIWPDEAGLMCFFDDVSERTRAHRELERVSERLSVLADAGSRLAGSLQPQEVLDVLAEIVVPALAQSLAVAVTDPVAELLGLQAGNDPTRLQVVHVRHTDPATQQEMRGLLAALDLRTTEDSAAGRAARTGQPQASRGASEEFLRLRAVDERHLEGLRWLNRGRHVTIALRAPTGILGVLTVAAGVDEHLDQVLLVDLATRAAVALDNALSFARQHQAATVLQRALLPRTAPTVPHVQVATRYLPASAHALAGGDFFKTVSVDGRLVCALGDVMGHGLASAARAGQLHGLVAALALEGLRPAALLTQLAAGIEQMMDLELATLLVCSYDPLTRTLTAASAGHPPPLFAPPGAEPFFLDLVPGTPIGVAADRYVDVSRVLDADATCVLFSDGLVERRSESISVGLERLRTSVADLGLAPEAAADHILRVLQAEAGGDDDIAMLVLRHPAAACGGSA